MKSFIVTITDEVRCPKLGEYYSHGGHEDACFIEHVELEAETTQPERIVRVVAIPDDLDLGKIAVGAQLDKNSSAPMAAQIGAAIRSALTGNAE